MAEDKPSPRGSAPEPGTNEHRCRNPIELEVFGQKLAICASFWSFLILSSLLGIAIFGAIEFEKTTPGIFKDLVYGAYGKINEKGEAPTGGATIHLFWSPGESSFAQAVKGLCAEECHECGDPATKCRLAIEKKYAWYKVDEQQLVAFGKRLKTDLHLGGYSRYRVFGAGKVSEKWGWQWRIIIPDDQELDLAKFQQIYNKVFGRPPSARTRIETQILGKPRKAK
jgi:hypothetical protein